MRRGYLSYPHKIPRRDALILAALFLLAALALVGWIVYEQRHIASQTTTRTKPDATSAGVAVRGPTDPSFDVIRVTRDGHTVMAGRAAPGAKVIVKSGDLMLGQVTADKHGDWVMIPEAPLKPGAQVLTLGAQLGEEGPILSKDSAVISVPDRSDGNVFVAVSRPGAPTRILDQGLAKSAPAGVTVAGVDLAPEGGAMLSGRAEPGRLVRVYLDNQAVGEALTNENGDWELASAGGIPPGDHKLRGDQLDAEGNVLLRAEVAFSKGKEGQLVLGGQQVVVLRGNALWEIARNIYGSGIAYSVIFTSNKQQIRDPDLIYPGQIFDIPAATTMPEKITSAPGATNTFR